MKRLYYRGTEHGGFSEYSIVSSKYCYVFQTDISFLHGVLLEPMGEFLSITSTLILINLILISCNQKMMDQVLLFSGVIFTRPEN